MRTTVKRTITSIHGLKWKLNHKKTILLCDTQVKEIYQTLRNLQIIKIDYDYYNSMKLQNADYIMPYVKSQQFYKRKCKLVYPELSFQKRGIRLFFAGSVSELYDLLSAYFKMPNRRLVMKSILETFKDEIFLCSQQFDYREWEKSKKEMLFIVGKGKPVVRTQLYWDLLADSDFFLCAPGLVMPHCHNCIEAMECGTIPILSYSQYFIPPLEDMKNAIMYKTCEELILKVELIKKLPLDKIEWMQRNVREYYIKNLSPESFAENTLNVVGSVDMLVNNESQYEEMYKDF